MNKKYIYSTPKFNKIKTIAFICLCVNFECKVSMDMIDPPPP